MLLGVGLAMDAFSVSLANGLNERNMSFAGVSRIAGTFAVFQFLMPVIGWVLVHMAEKQFVWFEKFIPWIALALLAYIGGGMIKGGLAERKQYAEAVASEAAETGSTAAEMNEASDAAGAEGNTTEVSGPTEAGTGGLSLSALILQGIATSIDALSVGFTTSSYNFSEALLSSAIIGAVTFIICVAGVLIGRKAGMRLSWKASLLGGFILLAIGAEIWIKGILL